MNELYERLRYYRKKGKQYDRQCIRAFKMAIANGLYPQKCLTCYEAGIRYCHHWLTNFDCEGHEIGRGEEIVKKFI